MSANNGVGLAKAAAHPLRVEILGLLEAADEPRSPNQLSKATGEPLGNVSYHVKQLLEFGCLELTHTEPRRGAVEHFYRSTGVLSIDQPLTRRERRLVADVLRGIFEGDAVSLASGYSPAEEKALRSALGKLS